MQKKSTRRITICSFLIVFIALVFALGGCAGQTGSAAKTENPEPDETITETSEEAKSDISATAEENSEDDKTDVADENESTDVVDEENATAEDADKPQIVWIGDSLTQGSLGDDNHNMDNPQAPWRVLGEISGWDVSGAGFSGYKTHAIFWAYGEYNGMKDPDIV